MTNYWEIKCHEMKNKLEEINKDPPTVKKELEKLGLDISPNDLGKQDLNTLLHEAKAKLSKQINLYSKLYILSCSSWQNIAAENFSVIENATDMVRYAIPEVEVKGK